MTARRVSTRAQVLPVVRLAVEVRRRAGALGRVLGGGRDAVRRRPGQRLPRPRSPGSASTPCWSGRPAPRRWSRCRGGPRRRRRRSPRTARPGGTSRSGSPSRCAWGCAPRRAPPPAPAPSAGSRRRTPTPGRCGGRRCPRRRTRPPAPAATAGRSPAGSACDERATEGAAVPDRRVGDRRGRLGDQPRVLLDQRVVQHVVVGGHGADDDVVAVVADAAHLLDPADVDDDLRVGEPEPQQRDERLAAGHHLGVVAVLGECGHRLVDRAGADVVELRRDHADSPPAVVSVDAPP